MFIEGEVSKLRYVINVSDVVYRRLNKYFVYYYYFFFGFDLKYVFNSYLI